MGTDKFRVTGTRAITNTTGSQGDLRKAINYMVGSTAGREIEYSTRQVDSITVDGNTLWDANEDRVYQVDDRFDQDPRNAWSEQSQSKFKAAESAFMQFEHPQQDNQLEESHIRAFQRALGNLNLDPINCAGSMLNQNYKFLEREVTFYLKLLGPYASIKLTRDGLKFRLIFETSIFTYFDVNTGQSYELDDSNQPRIILDHGSDATSSLDPRLSTLSFILFDRQNQQFLEVVAQKNDSRFIDPRVNNLGFALFDVVEKAFFIQIEGDLVPIVDPRTRTITPEQSLIDKAKPVAPVATVFPIARLQVLTELDFSKAHLRDNIPQATIEITVDSTNNGFRYIGSPKAVEIVELGNIIPGAQILDTNPQNLDFMTQDVTPISPALAHISTASFAAGNRVSQLLSLFNGDDYPVLINALLDLFNQATRIGLLRLELTRIFNQKSEVASCQTDGVTLVRSALASGTSIRDLLSRIQAELSGIFYKLKSTDLAWVINIFYTSNSMVRKTREAAFYIQQHPDEFVADDYITDPETMRYINTAVIVAIDTIQSALNVVANRRRFELFNYRNLVAYTNMQSIPPFFRDFIYASIQDTTDHNPLINSELSTVASQISETTTDLTNLGLQVSSLIRNNRLGDNPSQPAGSSHTVGDSEVAVVRHYNLPPSIRRLIFDGGAEKTAALLLRNPFVQGVNDGLGIREMLALILSLYTEASEKAVPYLIIVEVGGGGSLVHSLVDTPS